MRSAATNATPHDFQQNAPVAQVFAPRDLGKIARLADTYDPSTTDQFTIAIMNDDANGHSWRVDRILCHGNNSGAAGNIGIFYSKSGVNTTTSNVYDLADVSQKARFMPNGLYLKPSEQLIVQWTGMPTGGGYFVAANVYFTVGDFVSVPVIGANTL